MTDYFPRKDQEKVQGSRLDQSSNSENPFPIVGVGVAADELDILEAFFRRLPKDTGMAFVVVPYSASGDAVSLLDLLQQYVTMPAQVIVDETLVEPNHVYMAAPGYFLTIENATLLLGDETHQHTTPRVIDRFLQTLADDQNDCAIAILLAGMGTDGTLGLKAVKEKGGLALVQSSHDGTVDGLPPSAIASDLVDVVGTVAELADHVVEYQKCRLQIQRFNAQTTAPEERLDVFNKILSHVQARTGHDFTAYKLPTLTRRLERRMQLLGISSLATYLDYLQRNSEAVDVLFHDFLISVTDFFRDEDAFRVLEQQIIPPLFLNKGSHDSVRVWVPGCATGEEAYSIAILLLEYAAQLRNTPQIEIFASDVNHNALAVARQGLYPESAMAAVSNKRLQRFFQREGNEYRVIPEVREKVTFATHNLLSDPPFSRLDLISCRNVLIYLERSAQKRILEIFHYALQPQGFLFLGTAETSDPTSALFSTFKEKQRIFQRQNVTSHLHIPTYTSSLPYDVVPPPRIQETEHAAPSVEELYRAWQQKRYAPPSLLVDRNYSIYAVFNGAGEYLKEQDGRASLNLLQKILPALRLDLRAALYHAFEHKVATASRLLQVNVMGEERVVQLQVGPVEEPDFPTNYMEVVFEQVDTAPPFPATVDIVPEERPSVLLSQIEEELLHTRERLHATIERYETANEELRASNEELQSMNEELRSTTEELETSKEEVQSINEELLAVNVELKAKVEEVSRTNSDLQNLIESTDIATIFLDRHRRVKRYTPRATELFNLLPADLGRPFEHISHTLIGCDLPADAERVLQKLIPIEHELRAKSGNWLVATLSPYRTTDDHIDGVVLTFVDVTPLKEAEQRLAQRALQQTVVAELGQFAMEYDDLDRLREEAPRQVAATLGVELCKVLEFQPGNRKLLLKTGVGWKEGYVGHATVGTKAESQAGYTLHENAPVVVSDLRTETRFHGPDLLFEHNVVSGLSVVIHGTERAYGVLGVHSTQVRVFSEDDISFVQSVANLLALAIERSSAKDELQQINTDLEARVEDRTRALNLINQQLQTEVAERKRAQERFSKAFQASPAASAIISLSELCYLDVNASFLAITGYSEAEIIGRTAQEVNLLVEVEQREPVVASLSSGIGVAPQETRIRTKAGEIRHVIAAVEPIELNGQPCLLGTMIDITDRKQTEEALRKSQNLLADAEEIAAMGSWEWDIANGTVYWSPGMYSIFHVEPTGPLAPDSTFLAHIHPDDRERVVQVFRDSWAKQQPCEVEHRVVRPDGTVRLVVARGKVAGSKNGQPAKMIGSTQDITDRKAIEEALHRSEQRLRMAIEASGVGIYDHSIPVEGESYYNERFAAILGYTLDELPPPVQRTAWLGERLHPEDRSRLEQVYHDLFEGRTDRYEIEVRVRHKNGNWIYIRALSQAAAYNEEGRIARIIGVIQDITEQREREDALHVHQEHLQEMVEARTREIEAQTVLLSQEIAERKQAQAQLLLLNESLEERVVERTEQVRMLASALTLTEQRERQRIAAVLHDHLQQLLYALLFRLKLFQVDADSPQSALLSQFQNLVEEAISMTRTLTVDLSPPILAGEGLVEAIQWLVEQMKEIHQFTVTLEAERSIPGVEQEMRVLLFQLVRELLFNVLKHAGVSEATVSIGFKDNQLVISVEDRGIGFNPEVTYQKTESGWGLFSIRERLGLFGGRLDTESVPRQGTRVTIYFPLTSDNLSGKGPH